MRDKIKKYENMHQRITRLYYTLGKPACNNLGKEYIAQFTKRKSWIMPGWNTQKMPKQTAL